MREEEEFDMVKMLDGWKEQFEYLSEDELEILDEALEKDVEDKAEDLKMDLNSISDDDDYIESYKESGKLTRTIQLLIKIKRWRTITKMDEKMKQDQEKTEDDEVESHYDVADQEVEEGKLSACCEAPVKKYSKAAGRYVCSECAKICDVIDQEEEVTEEMDQEFEEEEEDTVAESYFHDMDNSMGTKEEVVEAILVALDDCENVPMGVTEFVEEVNAQYPDNEYADASLKNFVYNALRYMRKIDKIERVSHGSYQMVDKFSEEFNIDKIVREDIELQNGVLGQ